MAKRKSEETKGSEDAGKNAQNLLHPRFAQALVGHSSAESTFLRAFKSGALHHAWLLTGGEGVGKATFAYHAARFLLSRHEEDAPQTDTTTLTLSALHPVARQIAAGAHPSLFVLDGLSAAGNSTSIGVEAVRKLRAFLSLTTPGSWRVMIVDPANDLTTASANALLKAIEEPPPRTVFFLISHGAGKVLPTIRSRCLKLPFRSLTPADFNLAVAAACASADLPQPADEEFAKLYAVSSGSPGRALSFIAGGLLSFADKLDRIMGDLPSMNYALVHNLIQLASGARNAESFARLCDLIEERIEVTARKYALDMRTPAGSAAAWAGLWHRFRERRLDMDSLNLDKGAFLLTAFSDIELIARKSSMASPA